MSNVNIGNNSGIIGDKNIIVFNIQTPLTQEQVEEEFLKLEHGDFIEITTEVDKNLCERGISIFSYKKNYWLQLKKQLVRDDFHESWIPVVTSDIPEREKKPYWQLTPVYMGIVFPFSYFFIGMDGGRYFIPLPKKTENDKRIISKVQDHLGRILTNDIYYNETYDDMLKKCNIEVI